MSAVTKTFIVLLVILSLLSAAGFIVFVNRTENFRVAQQASDLHLKRLETQLDTETREVQAQANAADIARRDRDTAIADGQKALADAQQKIAAGAASLADAQGAARVLQVSIDNLTAAMNASEAQRKALSDLLETTRTDNNTLNGKNNGLNLAINDLTAQLERLKRLVSDYQETIQQQKSDLDNAHKLIAQLGGNPGTAPSPYSLAPSINAVVRSTQMIGGIPYATISVGSNDQVVKGMKFSLVNGGDFLGELTVETVDEKEATGKLEGPKISEVKVNTEAKTQL